MGRAPRIHVPGRIYHVMSRGNGGQPIVTKRADWSELLDVIVNVKRTSDFVLYAYCLMTNHVHLLLQVGAVPLSRLMQRIQTTWSKRFNIRRRRLGHVFQGRFKSLPCDEDPYFKWLLRYIHLNPVKAGLVKRPEDWAWSSYREYLRNGEDGPVNTRWPLSLFGSNRTAAVVSFQSFVMQGLGEDAEPMPLLDSRVPGPPIERPLGKEVVPPTLEKLAAQVCAERSVSVDVLRSRWRMRALCAARKDFGERAIAAGHSIRAVAQWLGVTPPALSRMLRSS